MSLSFWMQEIYVWWSHGRSIRWTLVLWRLIENMWFQSWVFFNQNRMVSVIAKKLRDNRNHQGNIDQTVSINVDKISIQIIKKHYKWQVVRIYKINITVHFRDCSCSCVDDNWPFWCCTKRTVVRTIQFNLILQCQSTLRITPTFCCQLWRVFLTRRTRPMMERSRSTNISNSRRIMESRFVSITYILKKIINIQTSENIFYHQYSNIW